MLTLEMAEFSSVGLGRHLLICIVHVIDKGLLEVCGGL